MTLIKDANWHKRHMRKLLKRKAIARSHLINPPKLKPMEIKAPPPERLSWWKQLLLKIKFFLDKYV